jgi:hypothetical protein
MDDLGGSNMLGTSSNKQNNRNVHLGKWGGCILCKVVGSGECLVTDMTSVGSLLCMCPDVSFRLLDAKRKV